MAKDQVTPYALIGSIEEARDVLCTHSMPQLDHLPTMEIVEREEFEANGLDLIRFHIHDSANQQGGACLNFATIADQEEKALAQAARVLCAELN